VRRKALALAVMSLGLLAPSAGAQALDSVSGVASVTDGLDTTTYVIEASSGPAGEEPITGTITRTFVGLDGTSTIFANVTCLAVDGNRAAVIGRVQPPAGFEALLVQIEDRTAQLLPDRVASATDPKVDGVTTFTRCDAFLPPFPFEPQPVTAGDFQVIDAAAPPPPPPDCDEDDDEDGGDDDDDDDCDDDDHGH